MSVNPAQHAYTIAAMSVHQVLAYALVISVVGNVVLVMLFARLFMSALTDNTRALQSFSDVAHRGGCPMYRGKT